MLDLAEPTLSAIKFHKMRNQAVLIFQLKGSVRTKFDTVAGGHLVHKFPFRIGDSGKQSLMLELGDLCRLGDCTSEVTSTGRFMEAQKKSIKIGTPQN